MDYLLQKFFEKKRWEKGISDAEQKGIHKNCLIKLCDPHIRIALLRRIIADEYEIAPPHQQKIPKDNGDFRIVYINEDIDRVFLNIANNLLFEEFHDMIHPACKSYQTGIGCGKVVKEVSKQVSHAGGDVIGWKSDFSKYFDSVSIDLIDQVFDNIEKKVGKSKIIHVLRRYYHSGLCFDIEGNLVEKYQSLKQGCPVAAFLADVLLYEMDQYLSSMNGFYVRYSDDCLYIGSDYQKAMDDMQLILTGYGLTLNPKKVEYLSPDKWFKFLGFNVRGESITLGKKRVKTFQKEIEERTIKSKYKQMASAVSAVQRYLYKGDGCYSWATSVLPVINVQTDIDTLNLFVMDCIRAVATQKKKIGGLGSVSNESHKTILRGTGRNVTANRAKTSKNIDGYYSLRCMQNALLTNRALYDTLIRLM